MPGTEPYLITFAAGTSDARQIEILEGAGVTDGAAIPQLRMRSILLHADSEADELAALRASAEVLRVDADRTRAVEAEPSDTSYPDQWSLPHIGWDQLHGSAAIAGTATVAILDTGVDGSHPDLDGVLLPGASVLDGSDGWTDPNGHGTWMAGIVAAETDNGLGVAGTAYAGVSILPVTVLGADGTGQDSDIIAGVVHAADAGADVILMAFSNPGYSAALQAAIDYAWASGAVLVAATGNDGSATATFPAGDRGVIGVASTDAADELAASSNHGAAAFMAAPGVSIVTTGAGGGVATISGTSAAAASVAGAAALLKANESFLTNGVIVGRLARNADPAGDPADTGNGRLNLLRAMADASTDPVQPCWRCPRRRRWSAWSARTTAATRSWGTNNDLVTKATRNRESHFHLDAERRWPGACSIHRPVRDQQWNGRRWHKLRDGHRLHHDRRRRIAQRERHSHRLSSRLWRSTRRSKRDASRSRCPTRLTPTRPEAASAGTGTINDNDPMPSLSIDNATVTEGNSGTTTASFTVTLSAASGRTVTVTRATANSTAIAPGDYAALTAARPYVRAR